MKEVEGEVVKLVVKEEEANGEVGMVVRRKEEVRRDGGGERGLD